MQGWTTNDLERLRIDLRNFFREYYAELLRLVAEHDEDALPDWVKGRRLIHVYACADGLIVGHIRPGYAPAEAQTEVDSDGNRFWFEFDPNAQVKDAIAMFAPSPRPDGSDWPQWEPPRYVAGRWFGSHVVWTPLQIYVSMGGDRYTIEEWPVWSRLEWSDIAHAANYRDVSLARNEAHNLMENLRPTQPTVKEARPMDDIPQNFRKAYEGLLELVERIVSEDLSGDELRGQVNIWVGAHYDGGATVSKAAVLALRSELSRTGLAGDHGNATDRLRALQQIDDIVDPPAIGLVDAPVEVPLSPALRQSNPNARGFRIGRVQILTEPERNGWHLSVSHPERYPTWEELLLARETTGDEFVTLFAYMPPPQGGMGMNRYILHLYETIPEEFLPAQNKS